MVQAPSEIGRNEFDTWCWRRGLELREVQDGLSCAAQEIKRKSGRELKVPSIETIRLIRLPFSAGEKRRVPGRDVLELIYEFTAGEIIAAHFYPPHHRGGRTSKVRAEARP